jgi:hypothetical protein
MDDEFPGYETVLVLGDWDYSWSELRVYTKDGRIFYLTDSGCSCNGWNDPWHLSESDMREIPTLEAAGKVVREFIDTGHYITDKIDTYLNAVEKLRGLGLR